MDFFKKIAAVLLAVVAGSVMLNISDYILSVIYPLPDYILPEDKTGIAEHEANTPVIVNVVRVVLWAVSGLVAGLVASVSAPVYKPTYAYFTGLIFLCASIFYVVTHHSAWWIWVAAFITWIPGAHVGYLMAAKFRGFLHGRSA
ncbi:MAG: hypothetical protein IPM26_10905 [Saprospiraceae bacterium]|nr:hypothetical protein [Saprospiraceae bacterium]